MWDSRVPWQRLRARLVGGLVVSGLLSIPNESWADPPTLPPPGAVAAAQVLPAPPAVQVLDLAACRALALQKQPAIAAAHASLTAALARQQALENLCVPTFLQRDLPKRREQAALGLTAVQAGVLQAELDTMYAVQYAYLSYQYAKKQSALADEVRSQLAKLQKGFDKPGDDPKKKEDLNDVRKDDDKEEKGASRSERSWSKLEALKLLAEGRQQEAIIGMERALSLLREAIGLDDDCPLALAVQEAPAVGPAIDLKQAVQLALTRRPEIIQTTIVSEVTDLEVCAQQARPLALTLWTFAAGSDIHANPLPSASFSPGYRPGALGMEMPVTINGKRCDRVEQARIYTSRAYSVREKTVKLIRLETEQAYYRWQEASAKVVKFEQGAKHARASYDPTTPPDSRRLLEFLDSARLATDLRFELNRAIYERLVALIALERATAGGISACLDRMPVVGAGPAK